MKAPLLIPTVLLTLLISQHRQAAKAIKINTTQRVAAQHKFAAIVEKAKIKTIVARAEAARTPEPTPAPKSPPVAVTPIQTASLKPDVPKWRPLVQKYFGAETDYALRIMNCESGGNPLANPGNSDGSRDFGLMQVNSIHRAKVGGNLNALFDPETNLKVALQIRQSSGWGAWVCARKVGL